MKNFAHNMLVAALTTVVLVGCDDPASETESETAAPTTVDTAGTTTTTETGGTDSGTDTDSGTTTDSGTDTDETQTPTTTDGPEGACGDVPCADAMVLDLSLQTTVSAGAVANSEDSGDWLTSIDASAGGTQGAAMNPWVYLRFTEAGIERVEIDDESALASLEWHVAAKRYGLRLNSGSSGPGCVQASIAEAGTYASIDTAPADGWHEEAFYDPSCVLIEDGSGLPGSPNYVLGPWWGYNGCVTTTGVPFVLDFGDGSPVVKLVVESYYESGQEECNAQGVMGSGSGQLTLRWQPLN